MKNQLVFQRAVSCCSGLFYLLAEGASLSLKVRRYQVGISATSSLPTLWPEQHFWSSPSFISLVMGNKKKKKMQLSFDLIIDQQSYHRRWFKFSQTSFQSGPEPHRVLFFPPIQRVKTQLYHFWGKTFVSVKEGKGTKENTVGFKRSGDSGEGRTGSSTLSLAPAAAARVWRQHDTKWLRSSHSRVCSCAFVLFFCTCARLTRQPRSARLGVLGLTFPSCGSW